MYETLKRLFLAGELSAAGLENAMAKGWLTPDQFAAILDTHE